MFTQEKKDIKERLNALPKDDQNEIIASLGIESASAVDYSKRKSSQSKANRLTWEKFDTFLILISGGVAIGTTFAGLRGAAVGAAVSILYSWYIFNHKAD
jgi:ribosomal protein L33